jgi:putative nucleotidyltransferase with HDIG domain
MKVILKEVMPSPISEGERANTDYFDAQGCLLLAKGQTITPKLHKLLLTQKVFSIHYEIESKHKKSQFSFQLYKQLVQSAEYFFTKAQLFDSDNLVHTLSFVEEILNDKNLGDVFLELENLRTFDNYTYIHCVNVAIISAIIGQEFGLKDQSLRYLTLAALLHDIGKLKIPPEILSKPQALTHSEFELIKRHPEFGIKRLQNMAIPQKVKLGIIQHHERWNGEGYPSKLKKQKISLEGQIIALADVFDALTADRSYRKGIPPYHAFEMILSRTGKDFSPKIVQAFKRSFRVYPLNTLVRLNNGETGIVLAVPLEHPTRPLLRILFNHNGEKINRVLEVDLYNDSSKYIVEVEYNEMQILPNF